MLFAVGLPTIKRGSQPRGLQWVSQAQCSSAAEIPRSNTRCSDGNPTLALVADGKPTPAIVGKPTPNSAGRVGQSAVEHCQEGHGCTSRFLRLCFQLQEDPRCLRRTRLSLLLARGGRAGGRFAYRPWRQAAPCRDEDVVDPDPSSRRRAPRLATACRPVLTGTHHQCVQGNRRDGRQDRA